jgi:hypothetical protein
MGAVSRYQGRDIIRFERSSTEYLPRALAIGIEGRYSDGWLNPCLRGPRSSELLIDALAKVACPGPPEELIFRSGHPTVLWK